MKRIVMVSRGFLLGIATLLIIYFVMFVAGYNFKYQVKKVASDSMSPLLISGDFVLLERIEQDTILEVDKIYCYYKNDGSSKLIIHRLTASFADEKYMFQGDANLFPDELVSRKQIGYKYVSTIQPNTIWISASVLGFILLLLGVLSFILQRSAPQNKGDLT